VAERQLRSRLGFEERVKLKIRAYNASAAIGLTDYTERAISLRRGAAARITATQEALAHSRALMASIDTLVAELTSELTRKDWLWPTYQAPLESPTQLRSSAQETRIRAETMRDADARRMMRELAVQYEDLAALIENAVPRQDETGGSP
jgi:hypothetical protein